MRIALIDDTIPFDGNSPATRPLGGPEKAFAGLAASLAARGHDVSAINRCAEAAVIDGVTWVPWDLPRPPEVDIVIAQRDPALFSEIPDATAQVLWYWGHPKALNEPDKQAAMEDGKPIVVFVSEYQRSQWRSWKDFTEIVIPPGVGSAYLDVAEVEPSAVAVMTTHPLHGMIPIIQLWRERIHSARTDARLHIYSASLHKALADGNAPDRLGDVFDEVKDAADYGVEVKRPGNDPEMAAAYAGARLHLYPAIPGEMYAATLAESQAAGLPSVALLGDSPGALSELMHNGRTGYLVPDLDAVANLSLELLSDDPAMYNGLHRDARVLQTGRGWDAVAIEFESLWS